MKKGNLTINIQSDSPRERIRTLTINLTEKVELMKAQMLDEVERELVKEALNMADGNQQKAAKLLKVSLNSFKNLMKKYEPVF